MAVDVRRYTADARKYVEAALGNLTPAGARDLARSLVEQAQGLSGQTPGAVAGQVRELAQQLMDWSQQRRDRVMDLIQGEVRKQLKAVGIATRDDVDDLRKRVRDLERSGSSSVAKRASTRRSAAKRAPTKRSTTKRSPAKRTGSSATRSPAARSGPRSRASGSSSSGGGVS
jgi:BMFP domain-containing protein YqiC